jgi:hypothetical protein
MPACFTKCVHIVLPSLDSKELGYAFGVGDAAVACVRNGVIMNSQAKRAFEINTNLKDLPKLHLKLPLAIMP